MYRIKITVEDSLAERLVAGGSTTGVHLPNATLIVGGDATCDAKYKMRNAGNHGRGFRGKTAEGAKVF